MRRFMSFLFGVSAGVALMYLTDPDRGRSRRARLADQAAARARDLAEAVQTGIEYQKGVVKGAAHDVAETFRPEPQFDDQTLLQKVRSEALGRLNGPTSDLVIDISDGEVRLSGSLSSSAERDRLIELIREVDGVSGIDDQTRIQ